MLTTSDLPSHPIPLCPFTTRDGLPHVAQRIAAKARIRVAYLGGSITAQPGWRVKIQNWLQQQFAPCAFEEIHAAIGGTGSDLGVLRLDHDVLQYQPDLLFVEFAVNDSKASPKAIIQDMEGIVRKTWRSFPECDICFVYTLMEGLMPELKAGYFNRSAATMEQVADFYGIPSVHMGFQVVQLRKADKLVMKAPDAEIERVSGDELNQSAAMRVDAEGRIPFAKDGVHPYLDTGHQLYFEALSAAMIVFLENAKTPVPHALAQPMARDNAQDAYEVDIPGAVISGTCELLPVDHPLREQFGGRLTSIYQLKPGTTLSIIFNGYAMSCYDLIGPGCGQIEVTVGETTTRIPRFDGYCTYTRLSLKKVITELDPLLTHQVTLTVLDEPYDKQDMLFPHNRDDFTQNPKKYEGRSWYLGKIFAYPVLTE